MKLCIVTGASRGLGAALAGAAIGVPALRLSGHYLAMVTMGFAFVMDEVFLRYGFYLEGVINIYYEGASGSAKIKRILDTYRANPPKAFGDVAVAKFQDFGREKVFDADGEQIPAQDLYIVTLANGYSFAARGSGTEPKMKFYLFANEKVTRAADLPAVKQHVRDTLDRLNRAIEADARARAEG